MIKLTNGEEGVEDEEEDGGDDTIHSLEVGGTVLVNSASRDSAAEDSHRRHHAERTEQHQVPPSTALNQRKGDQRGQEVLRAVGSGQQTRHGRAETE